MSENKDELDINSEENNECKHFIKDENIDIDDNSQAVHSDGYDMEIIYASTPMELKDSVSISSLDAAEPKPTEGGQGIQLGSDSNTEGDQGIQLESDSNSENSRVMPEYIFSKISNILKCTETFQDSDCLRGCKWAPDGTCLLVNCADNTLRLFDLPRELYNKLSWKEGTSIGDVSPSLKVSESGLIYDFDWYPFMSSWDQTTACFLATSTNCPVHLYDAYTGRIRATYRGYDQYDEVAHAFCVSFNSSGTSIFCGYNNEIKIFDVSIPGRDCFSINTKHTGKQKGIISCIQDNPDMQKVFAAGSYRKVVGLYTLDGASLCQLIGHSGGITQVKFSPNGVRLYSAGRKDSEILCWDLRRPGKILFSLVRPHTTNQRIYFDLSSDDKYLISGSTDSKVRVWNVFNSLGKDNKPDHEFIPHKDCVNGVSFHRQLPILATTSGQRWVPDILSDDEDSQIFVKDNSSDIDNSVKLWWIGSTDTDQ